MRSGLSLSPGSLWCRRDAAGRITDLTRQPLDAEAARAGGWQPAADGDPDLLAFTRGAASADHPWGRSDTDLVRVLEDLIDVLISRGVMQFTDLPAAAQAKLLERRETRAHWAHHRLDLPSDAGDLGLP